MCSAVLSWGLTSLLVGVMLVPSLRAEPASGTFVADLGVLINGVQATRVAPTTHLDNGTTYYVYVRSWAPSVTRRCRSTSTRSAHDLPGSHAPVWL